MEKAWHNKSMLKVLFITIVTIMLCVALVPLQAIAIHKENIAHLEFDIQRLKEYIKSVMYCMRDHCMFTVTKGT